MRFTLTLLFALATACASAGPTAVAREYTEARLAWAASGVTSYEVTVTPTCFCINRPVVVVVRNGVVESRRFVSDGQPVPATLAEAYPTVDGIFDLIAKAEREHAASVTAKYDARYGYPLSVYIDWQAGVADEESGYALSGFQPR